MGLEEVLRNNSSKIIKRWRDKIIESYPKDTQRFLRKEKDRFDNPVGYIINNEIEKLYNAFLNKDKENITASLNNIIRVRAVQDFSPSGALYFIVELKDIIKDEMKNLNAYSREDLDELDERINSLLLTAFDIYEQCRYKIYELKVNEIKNQVSGLLRKANLIYEIPDMRPK